MSFQRVLNERDREVASLRASVEGLKSKVTNTVKETENRLSESAKEEKYLNLPDLPVRVGCRNAFLTSTKVLQFTNYSRNTLRVQVSWEFERQKQTRVIELPQDVPRALEQREGFPFKAGESVTMEAQNYRVKTINIPN